MVSLQCEHEHGAEGCCMIGTPFRNHRKCTKKKRNVEDMKDERVHFLTLKEVAEAALDDRENFI